MKDKTVIVIGAGFAGLAAATTAASKGYKTIILEKNPGPGGRAQIWEKDGFKFDMGPSWYWMPDVFEKYFNRFGSSVSDYYNLTRLDPSYRVYFGAQDFVDMPADMRELEELFEQNETGAADSLRTFLKQAEYKYNTGINDYVYRPSHSISEYFDIRIMRELFRLQLLNSLRTHVRKYFTNPRLIQLLEFPVLFLGSSPENTPAMYSLMNYADLKLGTWYPDGGMYSIVEGMVKLAEKNGVEIRYNESVQIIKTDKGSITEVLTDKESYKADAVVNAADYNHIDQKILAPADRSYSENYWDRRELSPSALMYYIGVDTKLKSILHHTLFFHEDYDQHSYEIYKDPQWPSKPLFYVSASSKSDQTTAPSGMENIVLLVPIAPGLNDTDEVRKEYFGKLIKKMEQLTGETIGERIVLNRSYSIKDFKDDYNSFKGNAYGLANKLMQTAFLKPKLKSKKLKNLFNAGQLTVPGPGVPPALISGQIAADEAGNFLSS